MTSNYILESIRTEHIHELIFAGDGVRLAGQIEYPYRPTRTTRFPVLFILHHAGSDAREGYQPFAQLGLEAGYAVFRWDKRGTGRSGAGGCGSTIQDAVNAYEVALEQRAVDPRRAVILAQDAGAGMLGDAFGLFARAQLPQGIILATNPLDEEAVLAIETRLLIVAGEYDWNPWQRFARAAAESHNRAYRHGTTYYVAPFADRMLRDTRTNELHFGVQNAIRDWLQTF